MADEYESSVTLPVSYSHERLFTKYLIVVDFAVLLGYVKEHFLYVMLSLSTSDILKLPEQTIHYLIPILTGIALFSILLIVMPDQANLTTSVIIGLISVPLGIYLDRKFFDVQ